MLLSVQQKYILEVLRKLGCLRRDQLQTLTQGKFGRPDLEITQGRMDAMLRQLRVGTGDVRLDDSFVCLARGQPDAASLEAVDVMLELTEGVPQDFTAKLEAPRLLRFALDGEKLRLFTVSLLSHGAEPQQIDRERSERIVWISASGTPLQGLILPPKHFFAARQEDGSHRFYGSGEP